VIEILLLATVVAFVPSFEGYTLWHITVSDNDFTAITEGRFFHTVGYTPKQFTNQMIKLWEFN